MGSGLDVTLNTGKAYPVTKLAHAGQPQLSLQATTASTHLAKADKSPETRP